MSSLHSCYALTTKRCIENSLISGGDKMGATGARSKLQLVKVPFRAQGRIDVNLEQKSNIPVKGLLWGQAQAFRGAQAQGTEPAYHQVLLTTNTMAHQFKPVLSDGQGIGLSPVRIVSFGQSVSRGLKRVMMRMARSIASGVNGKRTDQRAGQFNLQKIDKLKRINGLVLGRHRNSLRCFCFVTDTVREGRAAAQALASLPQIFGLAGEGAL